jgi:hypothetical protein
MAFRSAGSCGIHRTFCFLAVVLNEIESQIRLEVISRSASVWPSGTLAEKSAFDNAPSVALEPQLILYRLTARGCPFGWAELFLSKD